MQIFSKKNKGFTLIELLVVIAIIGILSTIVLVSMGSARAKARDAKRQSDIRQIATAMELAYTDNNNAYVTTTDSTRLLITYSQFTNYLATTPTDPGGGTVANCNVTGTGYVSLAGSSTQYCIYACMESNTTLPVFAASRTGVKGLTGVPATVGDCE